MKNKFLALAMVAASVIGVSSLSASDAVYADVSCPPGSSNSSATTIAECNIPDDPTGAGGDLSGVLSTIINVVLGFIGIIAILVMILGGITFLTSQGDANKVTKGKNTLLYGIVGLIIALMSFAIVNFVLKGVFTGSGGGAGGGSTASTARSR